MPEQDHAFLLKMITPEQIIYQQLATKLVVSTLEGEITILSHHTPLVTAILPGEVKIVEAAGGGRTEKERTMAVSEGVVEIRDNVVNLLVQQAERAEELDCQKIEEAKKMAEKLIENARKVGVDKREFATLETSLQREIARLKVYEKYRKRKNL
jgi:F-type H+-transporting ATPase subunit epsilon